MGLGKTLSALANITRTSKLAYEFMHRAKSNAGDNAIVDDSKIRSRATLIIVPTPGTSRSKILQEVYSVLTDGAELIGEWSKEIDRRVLLGPPILLLLMG